MAKAPTATENQLNALHEFVCKQLMILLKDAEPEIQLKALSNAIKFLKDNHIEALPTSANSLDELVEEVGHLPFMNNG